MTFLSPRASPNGKLKVPARACRRIEHFITMPPFVPGSSGRRLRSWVKGASAPSPWPKGITHRHLNYLITTKHHGNRLNLLQTRKRRTMGPSTTPMIRLLISTPSCRTRNRTFGAGRMPSASHDWLPACGAHQADGRRWRLPRSQPLAFPQPPYEAECSASS